MAVQPSLAMIPAGYKAGTLYSQLPVDGVGDFTVSRNSVATRINASGLIEEVGLNVPRLDYLNGSCPELLCEPQSTNLFTYSEDFSNANWSKSGLSVSPNAGISPDGSNNAFRLFSATDGNLFQSVANTSQTNTITFYVKSNGAGKDNFQLRLGNNVQSFTATNEWVRYGYTLTNPTSTVAAIRNEPGEEIDILIQFAQIELLDYETSYIKTEAATVTRLADELTGAGDVNTFNSSEGVVFAEIRALIDDLSIRVISLNDGTTNNRLTIFYNFSVNSNIRVQFITSGALQADMNFTLPSILDLNKVAFKYSENDFALWINGLEVATDNSGSVPASNTFNNLSFDSGAGSEDFYGRVKQILTFNTDLSDSELQTLTTQ